MFAVAAYDSGAVMAVDKRADTEVGAGVDAEADFVVYIWPGTAVVVGDDTGVHAGSEAVQIHLDFEHIEQLVHGGEI